MRLTCVLLLFCLLFVVCPAKLVLSEEGKFVEEPDEEKILKFEDPVKVKEIEDGEKDWVNQIIEEEGIHVDGYQNVNEEGKIEERIVINLPDGPIIVTKGEPITMEVAQICPITEQVTTDVLLVSTDSPMVRCNGVDALMARFMVLSNYGYTKVTSQRVSYAYFSRNDEPHTLGITISNRYYADLDTVLVSSHDLKVFSSVDNYVKSDAPIQFANPGIFDLSGNPYDPFASYSNIVTVVGYDAVGDGIIGDLVLVYEYLVE